MKDEQAALEWFEEQHGNDDLRFFSPAGWLNWALSLAELGKWEEASQRLAEQDDCWNEMPTLAFVDGTINAAMLIPSEFRKDVMNGVPLFKGMQPNQGANAENHHLRATACFEFVEQWLSHQDILDRKWTRAITDWLLWLRLMNPDVEGVRAARDEVKRSMKDAKRAVDTIRFAFAFDISFDTKPLEEYLNQRKDLARISHKFFNTPC